MRDEHPNRQSVWLFPGRAATDLPITPVTINKVLRRACKILGSGFLFLRQNKGNPFVICGPHVHSHGMRKFVVCRLMQENRLEHVSKWIGHRTVNTTFTTYWPVVCVCEQKPPSAGCTATGIDGRNANSMVKGYFPRRNYRYNPNTKRSTLGFGYGIRPCKCGRFEPHLHGFAYRLLEDAFQQGRWGVLGNQDLLMQREKKNGSCWLFLVIVPINGF